MNTKDIQILTTFGCFRYLQVVWIRIIFPDDVESIVLMPSKRLTSVRMGNGLKYIYL